MFNKPNLPLKKKILYLLIVLCLAVGGWFINSYFNSAGYFLSRLPAKYKYYPTLGQPVISANHQIKLEFKGKPASFYEDSVHKILVVSRQYDDTHGSTRGFASYYRFNSDGTLLDSLRESSDYGVLFEGHLLYDTYYTDYLLGNGLKQLPYTDINKGLTMSKDSLQAVINRLSKTADALITGDGIPNETVVQFSIKRKVYRLFAPLGMLLNYELKFSTGFNLITPATRYNEKTGSYDWQSRRSLIHLDYFLKEEYNSESGPALYAEAPMTTAANWSGTGYFSVPFARDTLHFRHPFYFFPGGGDDKPQYENMQWGKLDLFNVPGLNFMILTVGYDEDDMHELDGCYFILPK